MEGDAAEPNGNNKKASEGNQRAPYREKPFTPQEVEAPELQGERCYLPPDRASRRIQRPRLQQPTAPRTESKIPSKPKPVNKSALKLASPSVKSAVAKWKESGVLLEMCCLCDKTQTDPLFKIYPYHS